MREKAVLTAQQVHEDLVGTASISGDRLAQPAHFLAAGNGRLFVAPFDAEKLDLLRRPILRYLPGDGDFFGSAGAIVGDGLLQAGGAWVCGEYHLGPAADGDGHVEFGARSEQHRGCAGRGGSPQAVHKAQCGQLWAVDVQ